MISAEDLGSVKPSKPYTSILPYLKAEQAKKDSQTEHKAEPTTAEPEGKANTEDMKTSLKRIHPSATEAELDSMVKDAMG